MNEIKKLQPEREVFKADPTEVDENVKATASVAQREISKAEYETATAAADAVVKVADAIAKAAVANMEWETAKMKFVVAKAAGKARWVA